MQQYPEAAVERAMKVQDISRSSASKAESKASSRGNDRKGLSLYRDKYLDFSVQHLTRSFVPNMAFNSATAG
jgi:hypothetical protein